MSPLSNIFCSRKWNLENAFIYIKSYLFPKELVYGIKPDLRILPPNPSNPARISKNRSHWISKK